jgi:hypothetical protein
MPQSYYIYYRVAPDHARACRERVKHLFSEVRREAGIFGQLFMKRGEPLLWMEVYDSVHDGRTFERVHEQAVANCRIVECLQPGTSRHVECFEPWRETGTPASSGRGSG